MTFSAGWVIAQVSGSGQVPSFKHDSIPGVLVADYQNILPTTSEPGSGFRLTGATRGELSYCIHKNHRSFELYFARATQLAMMQHAFTTTEGWQGAGVYSKDYLSDNYTCVKGSKIPLPAVTPEPPAALELDPLIGPLRITAAGAALAGLVALFASMALVGVRGKAAGLARVGVVFGGLVVLGAIGTIAWSGWVASTR